MIRRECGSCTLCCKLMPVVEIGKKANTRCSYQRTGKGCSVYRKPQMPASCQIWACRWVTGDAADLRRPDRSHYVIDVLPDFVTFVDNETGTPTKIPVVQVWCDPDYPDAHRDPGLRAYLDRGGHIALVRYDSKRAFVIAPPSVASDNEWHELQSNMDPEGQHTAREIAEVVGERDMPKLADHYETA